MAVLVLGGCGNTGGGSPSPSNPSAQSDEAALAQDVQTEVEAECHKDARLANASINSLDCQFNRDGTTAICLGDASTPDGGKAQLGIDITFGQGDSFVWRITDCRDTGTSLIC